MPNMKKLQQHWIPLANKCGGKSKQGRETEFGMQRNRRDEKETCRCTRTRVKAIRLNLFVCWCYFSFSLSLSYCSVSLLRVLLSASIVCFIHCQKSEVYERQVRIHIWTKHEPFWQCSLSMYNVHWVHIVQMPWGRTE